MSDRGAFQCKRFCRTWRVVSKYRRLTSTGGTTIIRPEKTAKVDQELTFAQCCAYMHLPLEERLKRLAAQTDQMAAYYEQEPEHTERIAWQGEDIVEP
jgi:shikimate kinase